MFLLNVSGAIDQKVGGIEQKVGGIEQKIEQLEAQQAKFQQDISSTLQAILAASQMTDSERTAAEETRRVLSVWRAALTAGSHVANVDGCGVVTHGPDKDGHVKTRQLDGSERGPIHISKLLQPKETHTQALTGVELLGGAKFRPSGWANHYPGWSKKKEPPANSEPEPEP